MEPTDFDRLLIQTLREVVAGSERVVYRTPHPDGETCVYRHGRRPSCGIGHVADRLDLPVEEGVGAGNLATMWGASEEVADALTIFQGKQDVKYEWGVALNAAEAHLAQHAVVIP